MRMQFYALFFMVVLVKCEGEEQVKEVERRWVEMGRESDAGQESFHHHHHHYHDYHIGPSGDFQHNHHHEGSFDRNGEVDYSTLNTTGIPIEFAMAINEQTVSDLLLNYIEDVPPTLETPQINSRFGDSDAAASKTERNLAKMARPAKCIPELTTVKIIESDDPNVFYVPECTRIERCGGCCTHHLLSCQPIETETVTFSVIKTEYGGGSKLKYVGKEPVLVEKHTKCKCGCKIKAEDCNIYQEYSASDCRCFCKNIDEEKKCYKNPQKKLWNPDNCSCQCRQVSPCSTNYEFDYNECRCVKSQVKRRYILSERRKEFPETVENNESN